MFQEYCRRTLPKNLREVAWELGISVLIGIVLGIFCALAGWRL
jgi:hypothetical protein